MEGVSKTICVNAWCKYFIFAQTDRKETPRWAPYHRYVEAIRRNTEIRHVSGIVQTPDRAVALRCSWLYLPVKTCIAPFFASVTQAPAIAENSFCRIRSCYKSITATQSSRRRGVRLTLFFCYQNRIKSIEIHFACNKNHRSYCAIAQTVVATIIPMEKYYWIVESNFPIVFSTKMEKYYWKTISFPITFTSIFDSPIVFFYILKCDK